MSERDPAIVVIGATGYTGHLVARELMDVDTPVVLAGRDPIRLAAIAEATGADTTQLVEVTDPASLRRLIRPGDAVINTAGPFTELGEPVVRACIEAGAHYFDTTGEQPFMHEIRERHHAAARDAGVAIVNAMAFEYALGDAATALAARGLGPLASLDVVYAWAGTASSVGTRRTILRMLGRRSWVRRDGTFRTLAPGGHHRTVTLESGRTLHAVAFGAGEVVLAPRYVAVEDARGWLVMGSLPARLVPLVAPTLPLLVPALRPILEPLVTRRPDPSPAQRETSAFTIRVELEARDGPRRAVEVHGTDPYGLTAVAAVYGARRSMTAEGPSGVLAPSQLVDPDSFLETLGGHGLRLVWDGEGA